MDRGIEKLPIPEELRSRYTDLESLGSGAMGEVYGAYDTTLAKHVAIKVLKHGTITPETAMRFQQEARVASKLQHQNLVTLMDFGISKKSEPYLIMEWAQGRNLADILEEVGVLSLSEAVNIARQICLGMAHAHNNGVIHRDLKPSNVIVMGDDLATATIKVLDFGIAKLSDDTEGGITRVGTVLGTPYYMSPEQFGADCHVDKRSDIYAAGSILFRMLTAAHPFESETLLDMMEEKETCVAPLMREVSDFETEEEIEEIVARCLKRDPDERYRSMEELNDALSHAMETINSREEASAKTSEPEKFFHWPEDKKKSKVKVFATFALVLCLIGVSTYFGLGALEHQPTHDTKVPEDTGFEDAVDKRESDKIIISEDRTSCRVVGARDQDLEWLSKRDSVKTVTFGDEDSTIRQENFGVRGWKALSKMKLTELNLSAVTVPDSALEEIAKIPVQKLSLTKTRVSDAGLKFLENHKYLEYLDLTLNPKVTDEGMKSIATIKGLRELNLEETSVSDKGLAYLCALKQLEALRLNQCPGVTNDGMPTLNKMKSLNSLFIGGTGVNIAGLKRLKDLKLDSLVLDQSKSIDDDCMGVIVEQWPNLTYLHISDTKVTGNGIKEIAKLKNLKRLHACTLRLNDTDFEPISQLTNLESLQASYNQAITNKTAIMVSRLPHISSFEINGCPGITEEGRTAITSRAKGVKVGQYGKPEDREKALEVGEQLIKMLE